MKIQQFMWKTTDVFLFFNLFIVIFYYNQQKLNYIIKVYTGRFIMFSVITNIYNMKTKGPTLMKWFTATGKLKKFFFLFLQLEMFDVCTTCDTAHIDTIFKILSHMRQHGCIDILHCCNDPCP